MNRNAILNAMEKKAKAVFEDNDDYFRAGKRGMLIVDIKDPKNPDQWDSSCRNFGSVFRDYGFEGELVVNNGQNFDALAHGKIAFCRRTGLNSGTNYYQVLGYESFWKGAITSDDGNCICSFAGFSGEDDEVIAKAGIACYESLKRTGKSLVTGGDPDYESDGEEQGESADAAASADTAETGEASGEDAAERDEADKGMEIRVTPRKKKASKSGTKKR